MRLEDVYDMTYAEFQIRLFAYKRMQVRDWEKVRMVSWCAFIGAHQDPKKMPKSIEKFMPLNADEKPKSRVSEQQKAAFLNAYEEYLKKIQHG